MSDKKQFKSQYKKKTETTKHTGNDPSHKDNSLPDFDEEMEDEEEDDEDVAECIEHLNIPDAWLSFPDHLPPGHKEFRHILYEGAHCLF